MDERRTLTIVGDDEADASAGLIGWSAPFARALIGARVGDERIVRLPVGEKSYEVVAIGYPPHAWAIRGMAKDGRATTWPARPRRKS